MFGFNSTPEAAMIASALGLAVIALVVSALMRWIGVRSLSDLSLPAAFLAAYVLVYNKIPVFPPVGAVNKVFYLALLGTALGISGELLKHRRVLRLMALAFPAVVAVYIGQPRLWVAPWEVAIAAAVGMAVVILILSGPDIEGESDTKRGAHVAAIALGFAPLALLGASSSSFQLCLLFVAASFSILVLQLFKPTFKFGGASQIGAVGGLIAVVDTVVLITRKTDLIALSILGLGIALPPLLAGRISDALGLTTHFSRLFVYVALAIVPAAAAVAVAFANYGTSFPV